MLYTCCMFRKLHKDTLYTPVFHSLSQSKLEVGLEEREKEENCFYLFELDTSSVCPVIESKLSTGSVISTGSIILIMYVKSSVNLMNVRACDITDDQ